MKYLDKLRLKDLLKSASVVSPLTHSVRACICVCVCVRVCLKHRLAVDPYRLHGKGTSDKYAFVAVAVVVVVVVAVSSF